MAHEDSLLVDWVLNKIEQKFGKMTVNRGSKHTFLGVDIEFMENGTVKLSMDYFVIECIWKRSKEIGGNASYRKFVQ